jgi:hypothetical protein
MLIHLTRSIVKFSDTIQWVGWSHPADPDQQTKLGDRITPVWDRRFS